LECSSSRAVGVDPENDEPHLNRCPSLNTSTHDWRTCELPARAAWQLPVTTVAVPAASAAAVPRGFVVAVLWEPQPPTVPAISTAASRIQQRRVGHHRR
jgi:hypothetical protein